MLWLISPLTLLHYRFGSVLEVKNVVFLLVAALPPAEGVQSGEILGDFPGIVGFGIHAALPTLNKKPR